MCASGESHIFKHGSGGNNREDWLRLLIILCLHAIISNQTTFTLTIYIFIYKSNSSSHDLYLGVCVAVYVCFFHHHTQQEVQNRDFLRIPGIRVASVIAFAA